MGLLENLLGSMKDTASISKATLISKTTARNALSLRLAVLRATSHDLSSPPSSRHLASILSLGNCAPRVTASSAISALMSRLHCTRSAAVALKCLLLLHSVIRRGSFILHDQISLFHSAGRRVNHLNLSAFRDGSSPATWEISTWIRWYARYLEQILTTSRVLGYFLFSISSRIEREKAIENLPALLNSDLLREIHSLIEILEEVARSPENLDPSGGNKLVNVVIVLVLEDCSIAIEDLESRLSEFSHRLSCLSFAESVEMLCALTRLDGCREKLLATAENSKEVKLWRLMERLREDLVAVSDKMEKMAVVSWRRVGKTGGSERFGERASQTGNNSFRFSSNRFTFQC